MRPASVVASRSGSVTSMVSFASRASSAADFSTSRRSDKACVTLSLARLIAAPCVLRSSGDILPSVASSAEIEPFLPSAATRTASSAISSPAPATWFRISDSSWARSVMAIPFDQDAKPVPPVVPVLYRASTFAVLRKIGRRWPGRARPRRFEGTSAASGRERRLGLFVDCLERRWFVDREIRQHLAVDGDAGLREAVDKSAVVHAEWTDRRVEALNPERAERTLLALAVAERILAGLLNRLLGGADGVLAAAVIALRSLEDLLVLGVRGHTAFDARHDGNPWSEEMMMGRADAAPACR